MVRLLVLRSIELLAKTIRNVLVGRENSTLLHIFDEGVFLIYDACSPLLIASNIVLRCDMEAQDTA